MKKLVLAILLATYSSISFAQNASTDVTKTKDFKTGICTISQKTFKLNSTLTYTLTKVIDAKNNETSYWMKITMAEPFKKTLNKDLTCSAELDDNTFIDNIKTKEYAGWFKGTLTVELQNPEKFSHKKVKHLLLKGEKTILYHISESDQDILKDNINKIIQEQI